MPIEPWWETNPARTPRQDFRQVSPEPRAAKGAAHVSRVPKREGPLLLLAFMSHPAYGGWTDSSNRVASGGPKASGTDSWTLGDDFPSRRSAQDATLDSRHLCLAPFFCLHTTRPLPHARVRVIKAEAVRSSEHD